MKLCALVAGVVAASMFSEAAPSPQATWSLTRGSLVYESHADDRVNIHRYDAGAARPVALTSHRARDLRPRWSPDGTRVAFHSDLRGNNDIYVIHADGSNMQRITDNRGEDFDPDWMPDGRLLFASDRDGDQNIWILDLETGAREQLTAYDGGRTGGPTPAGDGRRIAFSSDREFSWQVYVLDLDSGAIDRITGPLPGRCNPAWMPGRDVIAYMAGGDFVGTDLRTMSPSGDDVRTLAGTAGDNEDPQFSEDGSRLVWVNNRHRNWEIYEADASGGGERRVSTTPADERHPDLFLRPPVRSPASYSFATSKAPITWSTPNAATSSLRTKNECTAGSFVALYRSALRVISSPLRITTVKVLAPLPCAI